MNKEKIKDLRNVIISILIPTSFMFTSIAYLLTTSIRKDIIEIRNSKILDCTINSSFSYCYCLS